MAILHARVQPMTFTSEGDPQSTLTTVSPSTGFHDMKNGVPHVEKKALREENTAVDWGQLDHSGLLPLFE